MYIPSIDQATSFRLFFPDVLVNSGIGLALWNFRGAFGILDSGRKDVDYEDFHGHRLDRKLLDLLQEFA